MTGIARQRIIPLDEVGLMQAAKFGGNIGPFEDPATRQPVRGRAFGTVSFQTAGDPDFVLAQLQAALLQAITITLHGKLAAGQVAIPTLQASLPHFVPDIIAQSGAHELGAQITELTVQVQVENPSAVQPYAGPMPPDPMQATAAAFKQAAQDELDPRNYEYEAQVNVGGFKLKASTDGGFDADGLAEQAKDKAKSTLVWWGIGCAILAIVVIGLAGLGWWIYGEYQTTTAKGPAPAKGKATVVKWDGKKPYSCGGTKHVRISGVTASLESGTAISAGGKCRLELHNVNITAPTGISAGADAVVTVNGGSVTGNSFAAKALGNAQITFKGTKVKGKTQALGKAMINGP